jgi:hypothetical protein
VVIDGECGKKGIQLVQDDATKKRQKARRIGVTPPNYTNKGHLRAPDDGPENPWEDPRSVVICELMIRARNAPFNFRFVRRLNMRLSRLSKRTETGATAIPRILRSCHLSATTAD